VKHLHLLLQGWKGMFDVNVIGMSICTREAVKLMKDAGVDDGHVVNLNSIVGHFVGPRLKAYSATKYAVTALTEGLRQELCQEKSHIRTTSISPGFVKTEFAARFVDQWFKNTIVSFSHCNCIIAGFTY